MLLFNPVAGRRRGQRDQVIAHALNILRSNGFDITAQGTAGKELAGQQASEAIAAGVEAVIVGGGDGTVHDVLQGIAGTRACIGLLPLGSANALARELRLPGDPISAARLLTPDALRSIRLGRITNSEGLSRWFLSLAGAGPDGALMYKMLTVDRGRWGDRMYYVHALGTLLGAKHSRFTVTIPSGNGEKNDHDCIAAMALRVGRLGGLFSGIARGASLSSDKLHVVLVGGPPMLSLPLWFLTSWLRCTRLHPWLHVAQSDTLDMRSADPVCLQADGEWIGHLPASIHLTETSLRFLVPVRP